MRWADQLIKLTNFELEVLQKRLAEITERRTLAELRMAVLAAEGEAEDMHARQNAEAGWYLAGFKEALKRRMAEVQSGIDLIASEERGARDALTEAFETLKKYESIAENARVTELKKEARRENAVLDEMGLRAATGRR